MGEVVEFDPLSRLIQQAIALKSGNQEFVLYGYSADDWLAGIGNPCTAVSMLESSPEFEGRASTPLEAVQALIAEMSK